MKYKGNNVETLTPSKKAMLDRAMKPYDGLSEGPFKTVFDKMEGVFRKEVVNYKIRDGYLVKETSVRDFRNDDYHDTTKTETICDVSRKL
jgi:hypothetical protein